MIVFSLFKIATKFPVLKSALKKFIVIYLEFLLKNNEESNNTDQKDLKELSVLVLHIFELLENEKSARIFPKEQY